MRPILAAQSRSNWMDYRRGYFLEMSESGASDMGPLADTCRGVI